MRRIRQGLVGGRRGIGPQGDVLGVKHCEVSVRKNNLEGLCPSFGLLKSVLLKLLQQHGDMRKQGEPVRLCFKGGQMRIGDQNGLLCHTRNLCEPLVCVSYTKSVYREIA